MSDEEQESTTLLDMSLRSRITSLARALDRDGGNDVAVRALRGILNAPGHGDCGGGHPGGTYGDLGYQRCPRCGNILDLSPCGCGRPGHDDLAVAFCRNVPGWQGQPWPTPLTPPGMSFGEVATILDAATSDAIPSEEALRLIGWLATLYSEAGLDSGALSVLGPS